MNQQDNIFPKFTRSPWFWFVLICILTVYAYSSSMKSPFIFDDENNIVSNPYIRFENLSWQTIKNLQKSLNYKRPVSLFTLGVNYYFGKYKVFGYHIVNLIIHLITGLLLFIIMKKTLSFSSSLRSPNANNHNPSLTKSSTAPPFDTSAMRITPLDQARDRQTNPSIPLECGLLPSTKLGTGRAGGLTDSQPKAIPYIALFATALWLLNPIQIFSVTYIVQRMNSLAAMFSLLSLLCYIIMREQIRSGRLDVVRGTWEEGRRPEDGGQRSVHPEAPNVPSAKSKTTDSLTNNLTDSPTNRLSVPLHYCKIVFLGLLTVLSALLAIGSKQNAILLPVFILLFEFYFFQDVSFKWLKNFWKRKWLALLVTCILLLLIAGFGVIVYYNTAANPWKHVLSLYKGRDFNLSERLLTQTRVVTYYLSLIFYPNPSRMALLVEVHKSTGLIKPFSTLLSTGFLLTLLLSAFIFAKRFRFFSFAILWFFIGQLLESTVVPVEMVYIHRNYLPSMFLFLPVIVFLSSLRSPNANPKLKERSQNEITDSQIQRLTDTPSHGLTDSLTHGLTLRYIRHADYSGQADSPSHPSIHPLCGLLRAGSLTASPSFLRWTVILTAIILLFTYWTYTYNKVWASDVSLWADNVQKSFGLPRSHANYGVALHKRKNYLKAHCAFKEALKLKPNDPTTYYNIGATFEQEKNYHKAIANYSKALKLDMKFADAWRDQGNLLVELGDLKNGLDCLNAAWKREPFDPVTNYYFGHALVLNKHFKKAHFHLIRAIKQKPDYVEPIVELGVLYLMAEDLPRAKLFLSKAKEIDPGNQLAKDFLKIIEMKEKK